MTIHPHPSPPRSGFSGASRPDGGRPSPQQRTVGAGPSGAPRSGLRRAGWAIAITLTTTIVIALAAGLRVHPIDETSEAAITVPATPAEARSGQLVSFRDPYAADSLLVHRVVHIELVGGLAMLHTVALQPDGHPDTAARTTSPTVEASELEERRWTLAADGRIGRVVARIPSAAPLAAALASPLVRLTLLAVPAAILIGLALLPLPRKARLPGDAPEVPS